MNKILSTEVKNFTSLLPDALLSYAQTFLRSKIDNVPNGLFRQKMATSVVVATSIKPVSADAQNSPRCDDLRQDCVMYLTVNADCVTELRHVVMETCGGCVAFIRIEPTAHATRTKVWLGLSRSAVWQIMTRVMESLPGAEFGQINPAKRRPATTDISASLY
ncbi:hypothetical protein [Glaciimonas sp. PAMC28666]|uniref:hypothetical protein n=1 Tax=Glaciimonas sp. PAMC28666 TaxID=2807626 RepID=UPI001F03A32A|nr:hypothetical protein [Glaciimonas sp. PAMC28666]